MIFSGTCPIYGFSSSRKTGGLADQAGGHLYHPLGYVGDTPSGQSVAIRTSSHSPLRVGLHERTLCLVDCRVPVVKFFDTVKTYTNTTTNQTRPSTIPNQSLTINALRLALCISSLYISPCHTRHTYRHKSNKRAALVHRHNTSTPTPSLFHRCDAVYHWVHQC